MLLLLTHPLYSGVPNYISGRISQFPELLARSHMLWVARTQQGTVFELTPTCIHCLGVQLGPGHCNPHGCAHRVCSTQPLQKAFGAQHWLRAAAFHTWLTCLQCARALWSPPFVSLSGHSHNLLGVTPEGNTPLGAAGHLCPLGKLTEQSRAEHSRDPALLSAEKMERPGDIALCPLLPAALDSP